jgi:hemerythrin superfamily protein
VKKRADEAAVNAIDLLESQHRLVEELFERYEAESHRDRKQKIFEQIADNLAAHAAIEEQIFYPAAYVGEMKKLLREAVEEHLAAKRVIADLLSMSPSDENYDAKVTVLKELIEHHVEEEEKELFDKVQSHLPSEKLEALGEQMQELFDDLIEGEPRNDVPSEIDHAAPLG